MAGTGSSVWIATATRSSNRVATPDRVAALIEATQEYASGTHDGRLDRRGEVYGGRDLLGGSRKPAGWPARPSSRRSPSAVLGPGAFAVRGLFFDKTPTVNWNLPWHQDLSVAVRERRDVPGFGPWTLKGGIPHAHAPAELLARMVTIRLHLDDCGPASGPMRRAARLPRRRQARPRRDRHLDRPRRHPGRRLPRPRRRRRHRCTHCCLHASASSTGPGRRRVIHLEYAAEPLPGGLEWYQPACKDEVVPAG